MKIMTARKSHVYCGHELAEAIFPEEILYVVDADTAKELERQNEEKLALIKDVAEYIKFHSVPDTRSNSIAMWNRISERCQSIIDKHQWKSDM